VHHDAELAVIGIGIVRVLVRYLGYDQQRQKDKAHDRNYRQNATPDAAFLAEICLKSCQSMVSAVSLFILQNDAIYWTPKMYMGLQGYSEQNPNSRAQMKILQCGFFLRKKPLRGRAARYSYSGSAVAANAGSLDSSKLCCHG
jgi:hypothetical protein